MMKRINISTKFTILILAVSLVAIAAISFFSYDYHIKNTQEKFATNLNVIADNRAAYFNTYFDKAASAIQFSGLRDHQSRSGGSAAGGGMDLTAIMGGGENSCDTVLSTSQQTMAFPII